MVNDDNSMTTAGVSVSESSIPKIVSRTVVDEIALGSSTLTVGHPPARLRHRK